MHYLINATELVSSGWYGAGAAKPADKGEAGFRHLVNELVRLPFDPALVLFEGPQSADRRRALCATYRPAKPVEYWMAVGKARAAASAMGFTCHSVEHEAVDVIAQIALQSDADLAMTLVSANPLLDQVADLDALSFLPAREETQSLRALALQGYKSEGVEGIRGIGPVTARRIVEDGDPVALIQSPDWFPRCNSASKIKQALAEGIGLYERNLALMTLRDVSFDAPADWWSRRPCNVAELRALGLTALVARIEAAP